MVNQFHSVASIVEFKSLGCRGRYVVADNDSGSSNWWEELESAWDLSLPNVIFDIAGNALIDIESVYQVAAKPGFKSTNSHN